MTRFGSLPGPRKFAQLVAILYVFIKLAALQLQLVLSCFKDIMIYFIRKKIMTHLLAKLDVREKLKPE